MAIIGNINLTRDDFRLFREREYFYVDKTAFIEHIIEEQNDIVLIPRPRRMGKTMNLTMLRSFFDMNEDSENLFRGLYIENRPAYAKLGSSPVMHLDFKRLTAEDYKQNLIDMVEETAKKYLQPEQYSDKLKRDFERADKGESFSLTIPRTLMANIEEVHGKRMVVLLDEYDKLFMDSVGQPHFDDVRVFIKSVMLDMFKGNPHLERAVITGVNRIAQESMFSDLNNLSICDVFDTSRFDTDFGFTEDEVKAIVPPQYLDEARLRYNNYRVGDSKVYFSYSLLSFLSTGKFGNYWGMSGAMILARRGLNADRFDSITKLISGFPEINIKVKLKRKLSAEDISLSDDAAYYSMLVQTGYLAFDDIDSRNYCEVFVPNLELCQVWQDFILEYFKEKDFPESRLRELFGNAVPVSERFSKEFNYFVDNRLSYFDLDPVEPERTYHAFILGMLTAFGYKCVSNRESGNGRFDIAAMLPEYNIIFEMKQQPADANRPLEEAAIAAIAQIRKKRYYTDYAGVKPILLVGIGFSGKQSFTKAELL